jgi:hypothetical protein
MLTDAGVDIKEMGDMLFLRKISADLLVVRHFGIFSRSLVVKGESDFAGVGYRGVAEVLLIFQDAVGTAEVAGDGQVNISPDALTGFDYFSRMGGEDFFSDSLRHRYGSFRKLWEKIAGF